MGVPADATHCTEHDGPTVDSWSEKDQRIIVSQPADGFLYDLKLRAKIEGDPADVYDVLRDPNSHEIFRGIKATLSRTTLEDDGKGRRKLRIGHRALTKFLWISVTFDTELFVWEDDVARTIRFTNARNDGFMSKFDGTWHVQPFTQQTLDSIYRPGAAADRQPHGRGHSHWLGGMLHSAGISSKQQQAASLVTLEQALAPRVKPPGPVAHLVRGLCGRVLHNMMEDLRAEVARRKQQEAEAAAGQGAGGLGFFNQQRAHTQQQHRTSLPVASLTLHHSSDAACYGCSSSWGCKHGSIADMAASSSRISSSTVADATNNSSGPQSCRAGWDGQAAGAGSAVHGLMTATMPLSLTIRL